MLGPESPSLDEMLFVDGFVDMMLSVDDMMTTDIYVDDLAKAANIADDFADKTSGSGGFGDDGEYKLSGSDLDSLENLEEELLDQKPTATVVDLSMGEIQELVPGFELPNPEVSTLPGDNPADPMVLNRQEFVPVPILLEPAEVSVEVEEMLNWGEQMDKEAEQLAKDLFAVADPDGDGKLWWS